MQAVRRWSSVLVLLLAMIPATAGAEPAAPTSSPGAALPGFFDRGVFATVCRFSHQASDDPIVYPNQPGKSHLHTFFGNTTTNASSSYDSLRAGATTCRTDEDASGYWVPALYRNGTEVQPISMKVYYRTGRHAPEDVQPFPAGFRMIAGDATATSAQGLRTTFWLCRSLRDLDGPPAAGPSDTPQNCPADSPLTLHVLFPECWDGVSTDSPDHKSHVTYGRLGACPADHPVVLPSLAMIAHYPITGEPGAITLASGSQYSAHGDFFNGWDQAFLSKAVIQCLNAQARCGVL
ncbi:MAG: DUF1996 domain-containing protein [Chloroflexota bacterium]